MSHPKHFEIKRGDLLPIISGAPENQNGEIAIPTKAAVATAQFFMRPSGIATALIHSQATLTDTIALGLTTDPNASQIRLAYVWQGTDTASLPFYGPSQGFYQGEFEVRFQSGKPQSFPKRGFVPIVIDVDIG